MFKTVDRPALVILPDNSRRVADFIFPHPLGACFVDLWWDTPGQMPFHVLEGEIAAVDEECWAIGETLVRPLHEDDDNWGEWVNWQDYRKNGGAYLTDDMAIRAATEEGAITT